MKQRHQRRSVDELDALLDGRLREEDASERTRALASVAAEMRRPEAQPTATLAPERRDALRERVMAGVQTEEVPVAPAPTVTERVIGGAQRWARSARVATAGGLAASMIAVGGVAVAAQEALPGEALYGVKQATESVRVALAGDLVDLGRVELALAEERLEEVRAGATSVPDADLVGALAAMDERSWGGVEHLVQLGERSDRPELFTEVVDFAERQQRGLSAVRELLPASVKPHLEDSMAALEQMRTELLLPAMGRCDCAEIAGQTCLSCDGDSDAQQTARPDRSPDEGSRAQDGDARDERRDAEDPRGGPEPDREPDVTDGLDPSLPSDAGEGAPGEQPRDGVEDTTDGLRDGVEDTTDGLRDGVEDTTDGLRDGIEDTTDGLGDALDGDDGGRDGEDGGGLLDGP